MPDTAPLPSRLKDALGTLSARLLVAFLLPTLLFLSLLAPPSTPSHATSSRTSWAPASRLSPRPPPAR